MTSQPNTPDLFDRDSKKEIRNSLRNVRIALREMGYRFDRNRLTGIVNAVRQGKTEILDRTLVQHMQWVMERDWRFSPGADLIDTAIGSLAKECEHDPLMDMLNAWPGWDGVDRIPEFLDCIPMLGDQELNREFWELWLMAAVQRIRKPGCKFDNMLVLVSEEGWNKSSLFEALAGDPELFGATKCLHLDEKRFVEATLGKWIIESAELEDMKSARSVEHVKGVLSNKSERARLSYERYARDFPRRFVFAGSTNRTEVLSSTTGNRRFWMIQLSGSIDFKRVLSFRDQLWAQVLHWVEEEETLADIKARELTEEKGCLHVPADILALDPELWENSAKNNQKYQTASHVRDVLKERLPENATGWIASVKVQEKMRTWLHASYTQSLSREVNEAMVWLDWKAKTRRVNHKPTRVWIRNLPDGTLCTEHNRCEFERDFDQDGE